MVGNLMLESSRVLKSDEKFKERHNVKWNKESGVLKQLVKRKAHGTKKSHQQIKACACEIKGGS